MHEHLSTALEPQIVIIAPDGENIKPRRIKVEGDQYGICLTDEETEISVFFDYDGYRLRAAVTRGEQITLFGHNEPVTERKPE